MADKTQDMTARLRQAASDSKAAQQVIIIDGEAQEKEARRGRKPVYTASDPRRTVTYTMTESRRRKLKMYAASKGMTVSDVLAEFVDGLIIER